MGLGIESADIKWYFKSFQMGSSSNLSDQFVRWE